MNELNREVAAKLLFEKDLDLNDSTTVKDIIDLMIQYGEVVAEIYYRKGVKDAVLQQVEPKKLFCEEIKNRKPS